MAAAHLGRAPEYRLRRPDGRLIDPAQTPDVSAGYRGHGI